MKRLATGLAIAVAIALAAAPPALAGRRVPAPFVGVDWPRASFESRTMLGTQFARMARAGVETVRADFSWAAAQPTAGSPVSFAYTDTLVAEASLHHVGILPVVIGAPAWARSSSERYSPPQDPSEYAGYLTALIQRYGPSGSFWAANPRIPRLPLRDWQIWNEEDLTFWFNTGGADWGPGYVGLLQAAFRAAKQADPGSHVVLGALTNFSYRDLTHLYQLGAGPYFDVVALDPYTHRAQGVDQIVLLNRRVMRQHGDAHKPIWATEVGLPAAKGKIHSRTGLQTTSSGMARFLSNAYGSLAKNRAKLGLQRVYWFSWITPYTGIAQNDVWNYSGLLRLSGGTVSETPAFLSYVKNARLLEGCAKNAAGVCAAKKGPVRRRRR